MRPGDEIAGRYRLEESRGRGAMSEVWRAHDERLDRTVALKLLSGAADRERFRREAQAAAALAHENVMRVYDYGEDAAGPFMSLEWLDGGTLEERLARGRLPLPEVERIARGMAAGLAHLHERGIVHRDIKPANVLFDEEGRPKLADLGLARVAAGAGTLTEAGTVLGTAAYISPEQASGEPAGPASDVYSYGVILFRMLTGALPFGAANAFELMQLHQTAEPPAVETLNPDAPPELAALTAATLRKDPGARPADGRALLVGLGEEPAVAGDATQVLVPPPAVAAAAAGPLRRGRAPLAALLLVLALAGAGLAWAVTRPAGSPRTPTGAVLGTRSTHHRHGTTTASTPAYTATTQAPPAKTQQKRHTRTRPATTARTATTTPPPTVPPPTTVPPTTTTTTTAATTTAATVTTPATGTTVTVP